jgi:D-alanyl-lipoteichoic acid acyltransferase DltB (MBOAT superfamily)
MPYALFLLLGFTGAVVLRRRQSPALFVGFVAAVLFGFFWLKRYAFVPSGIALPFAYTTIGLSYVFFRVLHLIIDVRQRVVAQPVRPLSYLNYTLNFTALVSGPIQLYEDYHRMEEQECLPLDVFVVGRSFERIIIGFFKVVFVSSLLLSWQKSEIASLPVDTPGLTRAVDFALIIALYPLYLYANFSGYTDFVIGIARLFRIVLPENFNNPFCSENFIGFWSRWHITLSNWLKTYVYTPILMTSLQKLPSARVEPYVGVLAYFVTFFLVGAWHGQTTMFLFFGVLQGGGVALNKLFQIGMTASLTRKGYRALCERPLYRTVARGLTYTWFASTLLWFWSTWSQLGHIVSMVRTVGVLAAMLLVFVTSALILATLVYVQGMAERARVTHGALIDHRYLRTIAMTVLAVITIAMVVLYNGPAPDLVYKNF